MEPGRSQSTALPSRAILVIGGLGLMWLIFAGLLLIQVDEQYAPKNSVTFSIPQLIEGIIPQKTSAHEDALDVLGEEIINGLDAPVRYSVSDSPDEVNLPTADELAHERPGVDVVEEELSVILTEMQRERTDQPHGMTPELRARAVRLAEEMNDGAHTFTVRFHDPSVDVARRRAVRAHAVLVELGLRPWLLEVSGATGPMSVSVRRVT